MFDLFDSESTNLGLTSTDPILKGINDVESFDLAFSATRDDIDRLMPTVEDNSDLLLIADKSLGTATRTKDKDFLTGETVRRSALSIDEPGNNRRKAYRIGYLAESEEFSDSVSSSDRNDFYSFSVSERGRIDIELSELTDNADLYLRDRKGKAIAKSKRGRNRIEEISRNLEPGDYYVQIKSRNKRVSTDYNLELNLTPKDDEIIERSQTVNFSLQDRSLWDGAEIFNPSINRSDLQQKKVDLGWIGEGFIGWEYNLEAFLSPGTFDLEFPGLFEFNYPSKVEAGSTLAVNFDSKLNSNGTLNVELGASLVGIAKLFLEYESDFFGSQRLEIGEFFNANKELLKNSPFVIDVGLGASTKTIQNNKLTAKDTAFQYIDIPNALAFASSIVGTSVAGETVKSALKKAGLDARIGGNLKQETVVEIQGFEIDFDGIDNGNELVIEPDASGTLNVPIPTDYSSRSSYKFTPTVKPIVELGSEFSIGGKAMGIFNFTKAIPVIGRIPWLTARYVIEGETSYTNPWSPMEKFDPFANADFSANLPEISVEVI